MATLKTVINIADVTKVIKAKHDRVIIHRDETVTQVGSIPLADSAQRKPNTGLLLCHGARCGAQVQDGLRVMFGRGAGTEITINDHTVVVMNEQHLMIDLYTMMPFHNKVLVRQDEMPKQIKSIIIPDNVHEQPQSGIVERVGPDCVETVVGERILMGKFAGQEIEVKGEKFIIIRENDLFASL